MMWRDRATDVDPELVLVVEATANAIATRPAIELQPTETVESRTTSCVESRTARGVESRPTRGVESRPTTAVGSEPTATLDWEYVCRIARRHGVVPSVARYLEQNDELEAPDGVCERLTGAAGQIHRQNLQYAGTLHRVLRVFDENGVRAIAFKGPTLAAVAYGDLGLRQFGDLDFLVLREDLPAGATALESIEFERETDLGPYSIAELVRGTRGVETSTELAFVDPRSNVEVELRFTQGDRHGGGTIDVPALYRNRTDASVGGQSAPVLSPTDRLVVLSAHGGKHNWRRLEWIVDLAVAASVGDSDWQVANKRASARDTHREFLLGVLLVTQLFDLEVPAAVARELADDERVHAVGRTILSDFVADPLARRSIVGRHRLRATLRDDLVSRFTSLATGPHVADYRYLPLAEPLWPFYRIVRPFRLGVKLGRSASPLGR